MPEVKIKGKVKKFSYTAKGKKAAKKAMHKMPGGKMMEDEKMEDMEKRYKAGRMKAKKSHYGRG